MDTVVFVQSIHCFMENKEATGTSPNQHKLQECNIYI